MKIKTPCHFLLFIGILFLVNCKSTQSLQNDPQKWISGPGNVKIIPSGDSGVILLAVKPIPTNSDVITYTDLSLRDVVVQIAAAYHKGYVKFIRPVDISKIGPLGGGHTGTNLRLKYLLHQLSKESIYFIHSQKDSIVVEFDKGQSR